MPSRMPPHAASHGTAGNSTSLASHTRELVQAAFSAIWITTCEPTAATRDLTSLCRTEGWRLATWDCDRGMAFPLEPIAVPGLSESQDPLTVIRALPQVVQGAGTTLVVFENLHRFIGGRSHCTPPVIPRDGSQPPQAR